MYIKKILNRILQFLNLKIIKLDFFKTLNDTNLKNNDLKKKIALLQVINNENNKNINDLLLSESQLGQDLFVLNELKYKKNGYFVEFGAGNGKHLSNTYLLEKKYNWSGILAEPAKCWHNDLLKNRTCSICFDLVNVDSGLDLDFFEFYSSSTLKKFEDKVVLNNLKINNEKAKEYRVNSININDMLIKYNAPYLIDYLSIDTEGGELEILKSINFKKNKFKIITCEHNYKNKDEISKFLRNNGYTIRFENNSFFDGWYVLID
jgi:FkbM family methyltransferase